MKECKELVLSAMSITCSRRLAFKIMANSERDWVKVRVDELRNLCAAVISILLARGLYENYRA